MKTIAAVTIGQSPRHDVVDEMSGLAPGTRWIEAGALDRLDEAAISALEPRGDSCPLVTRLRSGGTVVVGEHEILDPLQQAVRCVEGDADLVVVLCSGAFAIASRVPILYPGALLSATVRALKLSPRLFVLVPHEAQIPFQQARWRALGFDATVSAASPYAPADLGAIGREARASGAAIILLDCLGYTLAMKAQVAASSGLPVILVRSLAARVAAELLQT
jgi:protein AroM